MAKIKSGKMNDIYADLFSHLVGKSDIFKYLKEEERHKHFKLRLSDQSTEKYVDAINELE